MSQLQAIFSQGFAQIDKAKSLADEAAGDDIEAQDQIESPVETDKPMKKKDKPNALVQVSS